MPFVGRSCAEGGKGKMTRLKRRLLIVGLILRDLRVTILAQLCYNSVKRPVSHLTEFKEGSL